ncbi:hypothetical protein QJQ45_018605, partial [Haematococcus lacustris]
HDTDEHDEEQGARDGQAVDQAAAGQVPVKYQQAGEAPWRPLELCYWPGPEAAPAMGKEYPAVGFKKLRDQAPKAQAQQPVAQPRSTDQRRGRVVLVDEHRTSRVSSAVNGQQPCESLLSKRKATRPADWKPPAGQVEQRLVRPAWSQQRDQPWPQQGKLPAKGNKYPGLGYKRLRDKPPKAMQQQQPAVAQ